MDELKTINEVCKMLDMTSRTIRYYEQLGLITTTRESRTSPRRLDEENIGRLKRIRFLRKLGLSLDEIGDVISEKESASDMIFRKSKELRSEINALTERIFLIEEVLSAAENGKNIYAVEDNLQTNKDFEGVGVTDSSKCFYSELVNIETNMETAWASIKTNDIPKIYISTNFASVADAKEYLTYVYGEADDSQAQERYDSEQSEWYMEHRKKRSEYIEKVGNCKEINIPGSHFIYEQKPEECAAVINDFIDSLN